MPFNPTDDALNALDSADQQTRRKFISSLSDEEKQQLGDAIPGWRQRKSQADAFVSEVGQGAQGAPSPQPGPIQPAAAVPSPSVAPTADPLEAFPGVIDPFNTTGSEGMAMIHRNVVTPALNAVGKVAAKGAEGILGVAGFNPETPLPGNVTLAGTGENRLLRRFLEGAGAHQDITKIPEPYASQGQEDLKRALGPTGAKIADYTATGAGMVAPMFLGTGEATAAGKVESLATRAIQAAPKGAAIGYVQSGLQGGDPVLGALMGGVAAPALTVGMAGLAKGAQGARKIASYTGESAKNFWQAFQKFHAPQLEAAPAFATEVVGEAPALIPAGKIKPSAYTLAQKPNGDKVAKIFDYTAGQAPKVAELPLDTAKEIDDFVAYMRKNPIVSGNVDQSATDAFSSYDIKRMMEPGRTHSRAVTEAIDEEITFGLSMTPEQRAKVFAELDKPSVAESPRAKARKAIIDVDAPVTDSYTPDFELHTDKYGHAELRPPEPPPPPPTRNGKAVRGYIKGPEGGVIVDRIANDSDVPGNVLVSGKNDEILSVPANEFHPKLTPEESIAQAAKMGVVQVRIDPRPLKPGDLHPNTIEEGRILDEDVQALVRRNPTVGQALFGKTGLVSAHHMGDRDMAALLTEANAAMDHNNMRGEVVHALGKAAGGPKVMNSILDQEMNKVMEGSMSMADFNHKYPEMEKTLSPVVDNMMAYAKANHEELIRLKAIDPKEFDDGVARNYLTRQYYRYLFPKKWSKLVGDNKLETAAQEIAKQMRNRGEKVEGQVIWTQLQEILGAEDPGKAFFDSAMGKSKAFDSLRARKELPPFMKDLLGEVKSGIYNMAETLARQEQLIARFRLYHEIAANPNYYSHGPQPHLDGRMVPNNPRQYGPLAGGYVAPEIYDNIIELPKAYDHAANFFTKLTSFRKGNQLASVRAHIRNNLGNWQSNVLAGGLDPFHPIQGGKDMRLAARALSDYMADPTGKTGMGAIVKEMRFAGADWSGHAETEIGKDSAYIRQMLNTIAKDEGKDAFDVTEKLINGTWSRYKNIIAKNGGMLDLQDRFYRVANYVALKRKFMADPAKFLPGVAPENVEKEAIKFAARRINDSFMNAAHVGKTVNAARKYAGFIATYSTSMAEEARILGLIRSRSKEDPGLKWRLAGWGIFGTAGAGALKYGLGGTPPEAFQSAKGNMTDMSKARRPGLIPIPLTGMGEKNPVRMFDASQYFLPGQMLQGDPTDPTLNRVFANALLYPVSGGNAEVAERKLLEATGLVKPIDYTPKQMVSESKLLKTADFLMHSGFVPAQVTQAVDTIAKTQYNGRWGVKWNPADVAAKMAFTGYVGPVSPTSPAGILSDNAERRDLTAELNQISIEYANGKYGRGPAADEEFKRRVQTIVSSIKASGAKTAERGNLMKKYIDSYQGNKK